MDTDTAEPNEERVNEVAVDDVNIIDLPVFSHPANCPENNSLPPECLSPEESRTFSVKGQLVTPVQKGSTDSSKGSGNSKFLSPHSFRYHAQTQTRSSFKENGELMKKRQSQKSEILTSSPYKQRREEELDSKIKKTTKKEDTTTTKKGQMATEKGEKQKKRDNEEKTNQITCRRIEAEKIEKEMSEVSLEEAQVECLICTKIFRRSKSKEPWIQCNLCLGWAHQACTDYFGIGFYVCDFCRGDGHEKI